MKMYCERDAFSKAFVVLQSFLVRLHPLQKDGILSPSDHAHLTLQACAYVHALVHPEVLVEAEIVTTPEGKPEPLPRVLLTVYQTALHFPACRAAAQESLQQGAATERRAAPGAHGLTSAAAGIQAIQASPA